MELRSLGKSGIKIAPLMLGGNVFGWTADEATSFRLLDAWLDAGFNSIDTADVYSRWAPGHVGGESETVLGNWFKARGNRDRVILATKVGMEMGEGQKGLSKAYIVQAVERSLARLRSDVIDLYQSHQDDDQTPLEETLSAYDELIRQGKVRAIGTSNFTAARLTEAIQTSQQKKLPRYESLQPLYNLCDRADFEANLLPTCREHDVGVITYFSLAAGFLTGKYRSEKDLEGHTRSRTVAKYLNPRGERILAALDDVSRRLSSTPAQVSLAWLMGRPGVTAAIASATTSEQLDELLAATRLKLDAEAVKQLDAASTP